MKKSISKSHSDFVRFVRRLIRHSENVYGKSEFGRTPQCHANYLMAKKLVKEAPKARR